MFDVLKVEEQQERDAANKQDSEVTDFLKAWHALKVENRDKARLLRLSSRVDALWTKMSQDLKDTLARQLFTEAGKAMAAFDAKAVKIDP